MNSDLNPYLASIGINIYFDRKNKIMHPDFELTLISALRLANSKKDSKLLSLILSWSHIYADYLIPEKLKKSFGRSQLLGENSLYYNIFCIYCFEVLNIHKFKKLIDNKISGYLTDIRKDNIAIQMKGEEEWSLKYSIHIPCGSLRIRKSDITPIKVLAKNNDQLNNRLLIGANWRADIITEIERDGENAYQISKKLGCSYEPVNRIMKQYFLIAS
jgi:hypothetical protein